MPIIQPGDFHAHETFTPRARVTQNSSSHTESQSKSKSIVGSLTLGTKSQDLLATAASTLTIFFNLSLVSALTLWKYKTKSLKLAMHDLILPCWCCS